MSATALVVAKEIAVKGFGTLFSELIKNSLSQKNKEGRIFDLPESRFRDHLNQTFDRCTRMKTLISRDIPINMLDQYVHIKFLQSDKGKNKIYDDYDVIDLIKDRRRATIQGTAGGGKTVFMRYLWISCFVNSDGRVPVFLELRRLNDLSHVDLMTFIFRNIITNDKTVGMSIFEKAVAEGAFIFVFDGFDEISEDKRNSVEQQILDISSKFKDNIIVVSGRPDSRFDAWQDFSTFRVRPMDKDQVIDLVKKVDFDTIIKNKFTDALNKDLYKRHQSFLSSPLLSTMMLLTFSHYAEIPEKIHVFYDLAFDTLFSKHDALKEAFNRKKYTGLAIDVFKRRFSFFCLLTYLDERYEFNRDDLLRYVKKSAELDGADIDANALIRDLLETVCMMHEDGLDITFTHRSFQEYFTAYCLARMPTSKLSLLMPKIAGRGNDSVFIMLLDMNKDLIEESYVLPEIRKAKRAFKKCLTTKSAMSLAEAFNITIIMEYNREHPRTLQIDTDDDDSNKMRRISEVMYPNYYKTANDKIKKFKEIDVEAWKNFPFKRRLSVWLKNDRRSVRSIPFPIFRISLNSHNSDEGPYMNEMNRHAGEITHDELLVLRQWFETTGHAAWMREKSRCFFRLIDELPRNNRKRGQNLYEILGLSKGD